MPATKFRLYNDAIRMLADARLAVITDDVESRRALDDAWDEAVVFVLRQADWRFAFITTPWAGVPTVFYTGFPFIYTYQAGWLRTHSIYLPGADGREFPVDLREIAGGVLAHVSGVVHRYVSLDFADPDLTDWPENFAQTVAAYLAFLVADRVTGEHGAAGRMSQLFNQYLSEAIKVDADREDPWLPHQRTGAMLRGARALLGEGFWRFALVSEIVNSVTTGLAGYSNLFPFPADWIRTHAVYTGSLDGREFPIDVREQAGAWSANISTMIVRYVSATPGLDSSVWPEPFMIALLALLQGEPAQQDQQQSRKGSVFQEALAMALAAESEPPNRWLRHQLDGSLVIGIRDLLQHGFWRYALVDATVSAQSGDPMPGFTYSFQQPADLLRSYKLFLPGASPECPIEVREHGGYWSANVPIFRARYISTMAGLNTVRMPEPFLVALRAYLDAGRPTIPASPDKQDQQPQWLHAVAAALATCADPPDPWLRHQLSGAYDDGMRFVMQQGHWVFRDPAGVMRGLKEVQFSSLDDQSTATPSYGLPYRYPLPADWFKTHALFMPWDGQECPINIRETTHEWSTDAETFVARYVGLDVLDSTLWPESISAAVLSYLDWKAAPVAEVKALAEEYAAHLAVALKDHARPVDDMLRFQLDGRFEQEKRKLIESGRWRFAVKTVSLTESTDPLPAEEADGSLSDSYGYRFIVPNDSLRTVGVYYVRGRAPYIDRWSIDFRDEQGALHANFTPISVHYVSRMALDSTKWPAAFRVALRAYLLHIETPTNLVLKQNYDDARRDAERLDDSRDRPAIRGSRIVASRFGRASRYTGQDVLY